MISKSVVSRVYTAEPSNLQSLQNGKIFEILEKASDENMYNYESENEIDICDDDVSTVKYMKMRKLWGGVIQESVSERQRLNQQESNWYWKIDDDL
jgi:hypothetical protein